jgi:hypothetical protein
LRSSSLWASNLQCKTKGGDMKIIRDNQE